MTRAVLLATLALWLPPAAPQAEPGGVRDEPFFPLRVGTEWHYRIGGKKDGRTVVTRVVKHEQIDRQWCARLETRGDGKALATELVAVKKDGVYRFRADGQVVAPPLCLLKLPAEPGTRWQVQSRTSAQPITGAYVQTEAEFTYKEKTYPARLVSCLDLKLAGLQGSVKTWYARGFGMVKQEFKIGQTELLIELEHFEPGK
jgi:hypothetical protein